MVAIAQIEIVGIRLPGSIVAILSSVERFGLRHIQRPKDQRIHDPELLLKRIEEHKLPKEAFDWYIDLRKYGTVPHGGFGMGIERCVAWICGLEHIRETIAFPRMLHRLRP